MKTYLFDTFNRFKRYSGNLDIATTLSNKTWVVFNDSGERELYIFQPDGSVYITTNGIGFQGTWKWIAANKSLIIHHDKVVYMLHPEIVEKCVLVLTLDGTHNCVFLIEDQNRQNFAPKTLTQLQNYFEAKERKVVEAQKAETLRRINEQMRIEEERKQKEAEERRRMEKVRKEAHERKQREAEKALMRRALDIVDSYCNDWIIKLVVVNVFLIVVINVCIFLLLRVLNINQLIGTMFLVNLCLIPAAFIISIIIYKSIIYKRMIKKEIAKYKAEHPNDPVCKYL